ncbi:hypothetical protein CUZ96_0145 [Enterococcus lactis]|nr:hypothetical protein [Enterococcus lactis]
MLENKIRARPKIFTKKLKSKKIALRITRIIPMYKNILVLSLLIGVMFLSPITFRKEYLLFNL